jgi:hypothetical protein
MESRLRWFKHGLFVLAFLTAYLLASWLDLWSTTHALEQSATAAEQNVYATSDGGFDPGKAWLITAAAGLLLGLFFAFGIGNAQRTSDEWLDNPRRSLLTLNMAPWSRRAMEYLPIHAVLYPISFIVLRVLAGINNLLIASGLFGPLGWAVKAAAGATTPVLGFWLVAGAMFLILLFLMAPLAAWLIRNLKVAKAPGDMALQG